MTVPDYEIAIVGAGFGGLGMAIQLKRHGYEDFVILERAAALGGTWRDNVYPGCACDIPSLVYSFSFEQNPEWSRRYAPQPEILDYMQRCAAEYRLENHLRFNAEVSRLLFDEQAGLWRIETVAGEKLAARLVVAALGPLNRPNIPDIPGLARFAGPAFHSSAWDPTFDPSGKRVAIVGTGASTVQIVPELARTAGQLYVFQRTPPWILPRGDGPIPSWARRWFRRLPALQKVARSLQYLALEVRVFNFLGSEWMNRLGTRQARAHLAASISDPELRRALTPDYRLGCKRVLSSDDFYPALEQENVSLVTTPIAHIDGETIVDEEGARRPVDAIVFGTGFVASELHLDLKIYGKEGRELVAEWAESRPYAYLGMGVSGYPNLFFVLGPNTGLGHNSVLLMMESQYNYILDYLRLLERKDISYLDLRPKVQAEFDGRIQRELERTVWQTGGCRSWYQTPRGENSTLWPGSTVGYRLRTRRVNAENYECPERTRR